MTHEEPAAKAFVVDPASLSDIKVDPAQVDSLLRSMDGLATQMEGLRLVASAPLHKRRYSRLGGDGLRRQIDLCRTLGVWIGMVGIALLFWSGGAGFPVALVVGAFTAVATLVLLWRQTRLETVLAVTERLIGHPVGDSGGKTAGGVVS